jgi:aspartate-semialdehyde dehydrogenase
VDFAFLAGRRGESLPPFLQGPEQESRCIIIDLENRSSELRAPAVGNTGRWMVSAPLLDREFPAGDSSPHARNFISAHPATIILAGLLLRLQKQLSIERVVGQVFAPVSEIGPQGIEELQKQTVNLLSFQKIPEAVFGSQLAFNMLPRLGRGRDGGARFDKMNRLEERVRTELGSYLAGRVRLPALRLVQVPVFYSVAVSLYVEAGRSASPESVAHALGCDRIRVTKLSDRAPSQVQVTGSNDVLVDAIIPDPEYPNGLWIWATADNMRLAAINAVEIAERQAKAEENTGFRTPQSG